MICFVCGLAFQDLLGFLGYNTEIGGLGCRQPSHSRMRGMLVAATTWVNPSSPAKSCTMALWVHHEWFPRVRGLFKERNEAGKRSVAARCIEADARSETRMEELVASRNNTYVDRPVCWLGFVLWRHGLLCQNSYGPNYKKQLQGSHCNFSRVHS